jgi:integrase
MNDCHDHQEKTISDVYVNDFNRVAKSTQERCLLSGEPPSLGEIEAQVALRAAVMKVSSLRREITSLRSVTAWFLEEETWPEGTEAISWVMNATLEDVTQLHSGLMRTAKEFTEISANVTGNMIDQVMEMNFPGSEEDAMRALSGMSPTQGHKERDKVKMQPITDREIMELELHLSDHPHQNALKTLTRKRTDSKALLRIFMRVIRLTGMRPVEVFKCRLLVGREGHEYSKSDIELITYAPMIAALKGLVGPLDMVDPSRWGGMAAAVKGLQEITGVPPILMIEAAKTTNANPDLLRPFRAQVLKDIDIDDLEVICLAAHLHHIQMDRKRMSNLITTMTRNLTATAKQVLPRRLDKLNLYSFRHDFATRARRQFDLWEVAALLGHTAKASTYTYGKRRTRKGGGSGGWMPVPDEEFAEAIRDKWGMKDVRPEAAVTPEKVPAETPAPGGPIDFAGILATREV